jgi:hypothetical protein
MSANDDDAWLRTLGLIGNFRSGVSLILSMVREMGEDTDIASAIADGRRSSSRTSSAISGSISSASSSSKGAVPTATPFNRHHVATASFR